MLADQGYRLFMFSTSCSMFVHVPVDICYCWMGGCCFSSFVCRLNGPVNEWLSLVLCRVNCPTMCGWFINSCWIVESVARRVLDGIFCLREKRNVNGFNSSSIPPWAYGFKTIELSHISNLLGVRENSWIALKYLQRLNQGVAFSFIVF